MSRDLVKSKCVFCLLEVVHGRKPSDLFSLQLSRKTCDQEWTSLPTASRFCQDKHRLLIIRRPIGKLSIPADWRNTCNEKHWEFWDSWPKEKVLPWTQRRPIINEFWKVDTAHSVRKVPHLMKPEFNVIRHSLPWYGFPLKMLSCKILLLKSKQNRNSL